MRRDVIALGATQVGGASAGAWKRKRLVCVGVWQANWVAPKIILFLSAFDLQ